MIAYPTIDPVLLEIGPLAIRWYSLSYLAGILLGFWYVTKLDREKPYVFNAKVREDIMLWAIVGVVLGGRIGYVLFYNGPYFLEHPGDALKLWEGGMSFHGGMLGVIFGLLLMTKYYALSYWRMMDRIACVTPIGLGLGRLANFVNGELYGRAADPSLPWAMIFPHDPAQIPRHPSQLYEALLEGVALFALLNLTYHFTKARKYPGMISGLFLVGYAVFRTTCEFFREPDVQLGFIIEQVTMGQILCLPMALAGLTIMAYGYRHPLRNHA